MEIKPRNTDYLKVQDSRSGGNMDANTLLRDFNHANLEIRPGMTVLDIGCRQCSILNRLYQSGVKDVYGIDIGIQARDRWLEEKYPFHRNLYHGDIHAGIPFKVKFDLITISHVLEHCYNPFLVLDHIGEKLKVGGYIHSIVPIEPKNDFDKYSPHLVRFDSHLEHVQFYTSEGYERVYDRLDSKNNSVVILRKNQ